VNEDVLLRSVTVYANGAYDRTFELIDEFENVLASTTLFVEDGEFTVELNFEVLAGVNYGLRTATGDPQLWREGTDSELNYPYDLGGLGAITNSTAGPEFSYYYFFYNWQVEPLPIACESERVSITASITGLFELDLIALEMYPNPALRNGSVMISNMPVEPCEVVITDVMGRVVNIVNSAVISLTDMATGSYLVTVRRLADDMVLGTSRLVVQ